MATPENNKLSEFVDMVRSWIPRRTERTNVSRDFWMPDQSCRVCYECDSSFTVFNRRHHCRICGRVFCAKCTANSVPTPSNESNIGQEDCERIRVCNFCFKQWEQGIATVDNGMIAASSALSTSPSATSLASTQSSYTCNSNSSADSTQYSTGSYQRVPYRSNQSPTQPADMDPATVKQDQVTDPEGSVSIDAKDPFPDQFSYCMNRSDDEDDDYGSYRSHSEARHFSEGDAYFGDVNFAEIDKIYGPHNRHDHCENGDANSINLTPLADNIETQRLELTQNHGEEANGTINGEECEAPAVYDENDNYTLPMDFENEGLLWLPPDPENEEDEKEAFLLDDDGDDEDATGEWGYLQHSSSFGSGEYRNRDRSSEEHRKAIKNVVDGHFRALIAQLLQVENLPVGEEDSKDGWLEIIMFLAWEAATLLKPDTSKGGVMDPGGYVKVKCIACGRRCDSMVVKGIVCKKNVAHRRMTSKIDKPRFLILGGALEYQRVSNHLSSFDTLLQQEMDHLKMAVAKIGAHHPNVLLVEKSVSRYAQEYLLAKDISLVLNVKRPLLERIARCTGAQIVPSIDHLTTQKLGYCDSFHVEKFLEEHGIPGQGGKKLIKPLMFFDGCPKPLGCTILLKGANADELKKVKHVLQYAVFAAYHLALETSFLADEGASLPELPLKSPITVALPDKPTSIVRSISTIPGFNVPVAAEPSRSQSLGEPDQYNKGMLNDVTSSVEIPSVSESESLQSCLSNRQRSQTLNLDPHTSSVKYSSCEFLSPSSHDFSNAHQSKFYFNHSSNENDKMGLKKSSEAETSMAKVGEVQNDNLIANCFVDSEVTEQDLSCRPDGNLIPGNHSSTLEMASPEDGGNSEVVGSLKEEFPPSPSDHQSILVSLSTRCVWKGTVCERAHLFRIKYYGSFDKPLGRFLRDHLFDQSYRCRTCESPSEAHVHCYTHRQGTLTISVKKLAEFLPGEREGKIWMWHRCLRCPRTDGFPPATRRVVMSDAAWGLSFGKFLELSFSNHAAASRVASCGHSIHRDCLRFYGFGSMVACFRYAPVDVHSVYLPPPKLEFNSDDQEWIQKEADEVRRMADVLFADVKKALYEISEKSSPDNGIKAPESIQLILDLDWILQKEKDEFEELLQQVVNAKVNVGQPAIDILEINRLRRRLIFHAYVWDQRLIHIGSVNNSSLRESSNNSVQKPKEKPLSSDEKPVEMNLTFKPSKGSISFDSFLADVKSADTYSTQEDHVNQINLHDVAHKGKYADQNLIHGKEVDVNFSHSTNADMDENLNQRKEVEANRSPTTSINNRLDVMESRNMVRRVLSEEQLPAMENLSDTLDAAWTGESHPGSVAPTQGSGAFPDSLNLDSSSFAGSLAAKSGMGNCIDDRGIAEFVYSLGSPMPKKVPDATEQYMNWAGMPFLPFYRLLDKNFSSNPQKFGMFNEYSPVYVMSFRDLMHQGGARLLLPPGINSTVVPVYDDEPTSIISHALLSQDYHVQISGEPERIKEGTESSASLPFSDTTSLLSLSFIDDSTSDSLRSLGSTEESILSVSGSRGSLGFDPFLYVKALHPRVSFTDDGPLGKVKYSVTFYHARQFEALRRTCCPSELDFIRSLSRCKKWGAQGGKSNVFFAKTLDDRFIIKQVTKTELESFIKFAPAYFKYLSESIGTGCPTCLAKILGIYQVASKSVKGGKETRMDVLVMENLLFRRNITRLYDLKGSSRSRYNPNSNGSNKVLLDQNLIEAMPTSPIFVGTRAKRLLERAVWNDTSFLASIDVMDYSLLVGVDEEKHELVLGIIDFMRQYTWDKHLETWVKASGILGGPKNTSPTVISPKQYKKRFRKAMSTYFLMVPDQWSSQMIIPNRSQSNLSEDNAGATTLG